MHQSIYPQIPPRGIYFESLVEDAFRRIHTPVEVIEAGGRNQPRHDLLVGSQRISIKTEIGAGTRERGITITKLCTTEREPWAAEDLRRRALAHLSRYDTVLMFRAIWLPQAIRYQLIDIPVELLREIEHAELRLVGKRTGRRSIGRNAEYKGEVLFRVHFDASDRKCSIRNLALARTTLLAQWDVRK